MFTAPLNTGGGDDSDNSNVPNRSRGGGSRSCGYDASGDVDHTGHGSFSLSNVIACENGVENGYGCCCHGVLIDKTSRDSLLKPDSGDNTAEVFGGGNEIVGGQSRFPPGHLRAGHRIMDWCQLETDNRQLGENQNVLSRQGQCLLGQCWAGQYQQGQSQPEESQPGQQN